MKAPVPTRARTLSPRLLLRSLLAFVLVAPIAHATGAGALAIFVCSALAIVPLAGLMGEATESIAGRFGAGVGGLLNATFGNAAELILALVALRSGYPGVVKASLTGSIIGNVAVGASAQVQYRLPPRLVPWRNQAFEVLVESPDTDSSTEPHFAQPAAIGAGVMLTRDGATVGAAADGAAADGLAVADDPQAVTTSTVAPRSPMILLGLDCLYMV